MRREEGGKEEGEGGGRRRGRRREEGGRFQEHHGSVGFLPGPKRREHLAALKQPDEVRRHQDVLVLSGRDLRGVASEVRGEALDGPVVIPLLRLEQRIQVATATILGDVASGAAACWDRSRSRTRRRPRSRRPGPSIR